MAVRDYSSIYSIEDWMVNEIAPKFFDMDNVSLLNVGQFGMTNHVIGTVIEDQFEVVDRYLNEILPQKANLPDFIYANAALYGIEDFLARPSKASMLLYIKESDVLNKSIYRKSGRNVTTSGKSSYVEYKDFVIDSDMQIFIDDVQYSIPYDVNIQVSSITRDGQKEYSYIATWIMDDINSIAEVDNPYIKIYKASYDGDIWIVLKLDVYQYSRKSYNEPILTNSKLNIPYFETTYSNQLCNFEVFYQAPGETTWVQLEKRLESSVPVSTPFIYYKIIDDETVRFSFANDDRYFVPDYNSNIRVEMYETLGKDGDFKLTDDTGVIPQISLFTKNEEYAYNRSTIVMGLIGTDSTGGRSKLSVQDIKDLTCEKVLTINSITTDTDLMMFAKNYLAVYQTNPIFIKYRDDPAGREYGCFIRLTDGVDIYPTNTPDILISADDVDTYYPSLKQYTIKPGKRYTYSSDKTNKVVSLVPIDKEDVDVDYTTIFLTIVQTKPNAIRYYLNTVDKNVALEYSYINNFSYYNFLVSSCHIKRNAIKGEDFYKISLTIMRVDGVIEGINRNDEISDSNDIAKDLKVLIIFDTNEGHHVEMKLVKENKKLGSYEFEADIYTDDMIDDIRISLTNLINNDDGTEQSRIVDMTNPSVHFCVFFRYQAGNISHQYEGISTVSDMTMCNEYIPYENEFYFALPMELTRSHVVFQDMPSEKSKFGFLIKQVPMLGYDFIMGDDSNIESVINKISSFHSFISDTLMDVTPNFTINIKFFNTYGRSKMFYIGENRLLDYVHLKCRLRVKFYAGIDQSAYLNKLQDYVKDFVENLNVVKEGTNKIEVSVLLHKIHSEFEDQIEYVIFERFNEYDAGVQVIEIRGLVQEETTPETVPEYITLKHDDVIITPL